MNKIMRRAIRFGEKLITGTNLDQELNRAQQGGGMAVPEIAPKAREMAAEGIVLLKNEKNTLPIRKTDTAAVFGRSAVDYFTVGYGSGGDVIAPYNISLTEGLREADVKLDEMIAKTYDKWCHEKKNLPETDCTFGTWPTFNPEMPLSDAVVAGSAKVSDIAVIVIGRAAGEARENTLKNGSYYLTRRENAMLDTVTRYFDRVCVVLDCSNIIDMSWADRYGDKIGAVVYAWQGGMESGNAVADMLTGKVCPSGRLTDTIAKTYGDYPSSTDFGGREFNNYTEDIYVGYRYFETFDKDAVRYPFGFGLSYTSFDWKTSASSDGNRIEVVTDVTNTGDAAGKEVVQVYAGFPCGELGTPEKILIGFGKTRNLQPGESQKISIAADLSDFAPYDDSGVTGHKSCHVLEAGTYTIQAGENVRDTHEVLTIEKSEPEVIKQLREALAVRPENIFRRMVNRDGRLRYEDVPAAAKDLKKQILDELPAELACPSEEINFADVKSGRYTAEEFIGQLSKQELDDLSHGEGKMNSSLGPEMNAGAFGGVTEKLRSRGIPPVITTDGPSGIRLKAVCSLLPCGTALASSFNTEGVEELYTLLSLEMKEHGSDMLLAPGMNIHRNPLCGRNFEYYSEDPLLSGKMAAAAVRGIQKNGASACPKHFACNNQEYRRNTNDSRLSERVLREIYLKGFEIAVKEAKPKCIMTSYNKINGVWSHYNYELVTQILRDEWGYDGLVITDWWMQMGASREFPNITNDAYRIRSQVDVVMPGEPNIGAKGKKDRTLLASLRDPDGVTRAEAQRTALNVINFILRLN